MTVCEVSEDNVWYIQNFLDNLGRLGAEKYQVHTPTKWYIAHFQGIDQKVKQLKPEESNSTRLKNGRQLKFDQSSLLVS